MCCKVCCISWRYRWSGSPQARFSPVCVLLDMPPYDGLKDGRSTVVLARRFAVVLEMARVGRAGA